MGLDRRRTMIELLRKVADAPGFDWESYSELNRLMANRLVDPQIGSAWGEATELYLEWRRMRALSPEEFYETTASRRQRIRELVSKMIVGQRKHGSRH